ncbi:MAG: guanine deaminase [Pseudomonadota bacterium]
MNSLCGKWLAATFIHAPARARIEIAHDALIHVDNNGTIANIVRADDAQHAATQETAERDGTLASLPPGTVLLPGFVDLHIHAPQWPQLGKALDVPLEVWLQQYTFPLEARYSDLAFAKQVYTDMVGSLLAEGTTTAVYFATIHDPSSRALADICLERGQRAFVGKLVMDNPDECPDYYRDESTEQALVESAEFVEYVRALPGNADALVQPIITPRFIPSCTDKALSGLGELAADTGCHIQTHCSESDWQHQYVIDRLGKTDTDALMDFGLIGRHTVLAHSNFLTDANMDTLREAGAGVAHCPLSNIYFSNAVFPLRRALEKSVRVGLGTDISGGPSASILDAARHAIHSSRLLEEGVNPDTPRDERRYENQRIDFREAFYLATTGGADVLDLPVGRFEVGCHFDALCIDPTATGSPINYDPQLDSDDDFLQKLISLAKRANIHTVWTQGSVAKSP